MEALMRLVYQISQKDQFFRLAEKCIMGMWDRYGKIVFQHFTPSQADTLNKLTAAIVDQNIYTNLARYRPNFTLKYFPCQVERISFTSLENITIIDDLML